MFSLDVTGLLGLILFTKQAHFVTGDGGGGVFTYVGKNAVVGGEVFHSSKSVTNIKTRKNRSNL